MPKLQRQLDPHWVVPSQQQWKRQVHRDSLLKILNIFTKYNSFNLNPGGDWHPGQGDNPRSTEHAKKTNPGYLAGKGATYSCATCKTCKVWKPPRLAHPKTFSCIVVTCVTFVVVVVVVAAAAALLLLLLMLMLLLLLLFLPLLVVYWFIGLLFFWLWLLATTPTKKTLNYAGSFKLGWLDGQLVGSALEQCFSWLKAGFPPKQCIIHWYYIVSSTFPVINSQHQ